MHITLNHSAVMKHFAGFFAIIVMIMACAPAQAQQETPDARISMSVSSRQVSLGEPFILEVTAAGDDDLGAPKLSIPPEFKVSSMGPSRQSSTYQSFVNGRRTTQTRVTTTYRYELVARETGRYTLAGAIFSINGQDYATNDVAVNVVRPAPSELLQIDLQVSEPEPFAGQPVLVTLSMILRVNAGDVRITAPSDLDAITSAPVIDPAPNANTIDFLSKPTPFESAEGMYQGQRGLLVRLQRYIVPERPGELAVGPISVSVRAGGSVFSSGQTIVAVSDPLTISVRPLPRDGRPSSFTGLVGALELDATVSPASANVGDPMTLRAIVRTDLPQRIDASDLRIEQTLADAFQLTADPPRVTYTRDAAVIEATIRPTHPGIEQLPSFELAYFDPATAEYSIARSVPVPLEIRAAREIGLADAVGADPADPAPGTGRTLTDLDAGLAPSITRLGQFRVPDATVIGALSSPLWIATVATPPGIFLASLIAVRLRQSRGSERAARRRALSDAHRRLDAARNPTDIGIAITDAIRAAAGIPNKSITPGEAQQLVRDRTGKVDEAHTLRRILEQCDAARFAGLGTDAPVEELRSKAQSILLEVEPRLAGSATLRRSAQS